MLAEDAKGTSRDGKRLLKDESFSTKTKSFFEITERGEFSE
mgnify:CR=1 FL=1